MKDKLMKIYHRMTDKTKEYTFMGIKEFCELTGNRYKILSKETVCEEVRPSIWGIRDEELIVKRRLHETYIAEIENAIVFGENEIVVSRDILLSDIFTDVHADKMVLNKRIVKKIELKKRKVEINYHNYRKFPQNKAFYLGGIFPYSYYHFMINVLPKLFYLYQDKEYEDYPLLIDQRAYQNFRTIIDAFNIRKRKILCIRADTAYKIKRLVVVSNCALYDRYVKGAFYGVTGHIYDKNAIQFVRNHAFSLIENRDRKGNKKRIYLSRKNMGERRRIICEEVIEGIFHQHGFISIYPEKLTFFEQVEMFAQAEVIAGAAGAAFTNMIFLPSNAIVIYFTCARDNQGENLFSTLRNTTGKGKTIVVEGIATKETQNLKDNLREFELDPEAVEQLLSSL